MDAVKKGSTKKTKELCREPMHNKRITAVPGIGRVSAKQLSKKGIDTASELYKEFLLCNKDKKKFLRWTNKKCKLRENDFEKCFTALNNWQVQQSTGFDKSGETASKANDLKLAVHIACHSAIKSVDHLGEIVKSLGKGSSLEHLQLHRTKCTQLIKKVIAPAMLKDLVKDVGQWPYSIFVDESTNVSTNKYMALCIRFYSANSDTMVTDFLGLVEVPSATAENLYKSFTEYVKSVGLPLKNLHGLGTDGASNLCGVNHSLYTLLRDRDVPQLELMKCICHSIDKCARKACEVMPSSLEFLIRESRNWFSHSALRKSEYKKIYQKINEQKPPPALVQLSATRWLAWSGAVTTTLEQWSELKFLFDVAATRERCYTARTLAQMYGDVNNKLYLTFLKPVLRDITNMNLAFQAPNADFGKIYSDLRLIVLSLATRVIRPEAIKESRSSILCQVELQYINDALSNPGALLPHARVEYGEAFKLLSTSLTITSEDLNAVKIRCAEFLRVLLIELIRRLPDHLDPIEKMKCLNPERCLRKVGRPSYAELPVFYADPGTDMEVLENQWRMLGVHELNEILPDVDKDNIDTIQFWSAILKLKTANGGAKFKELASFALRVLSLPISNAVVERVFSHMNLIKIKSRNKLTDIDTLQAVMRIRIHLQASGLYKQFLLCNSNKAKFLTWTNSNCKFRARDFEACFEALKKWQVQFPTEYQQRTEDPGTSNSRNTSRPCRSGNVARTNKTVNFQVRECVTPITKDDDATGDPALVSFFISIRQIVQKFPPLKQVQIRNQIYNIVSMAEAEGIQTQVINEPVASTSESGAGYKPSQSSRQAIQTPQQTNAQTIHNEEMLDDEDIIFQDLD